MHKPLAIFLFIAVVCFADTKPYFVNATICPDSVKLVRIDNSGIAYDSTYDTTHSDSSMDCSGVGCVWNYKTKIDTLIVQRYLDIRYIWEACLSYAFFDAENDSCSIYPEVQKTRQCVVYGKTGVFKIDSIWGDTAGRPGINKVIRWRFSNTDCTVGNFVLRGKEVNNSDSTFAFGPEMVAEYWFPTNITAINTNASTSRNRLVISVRVECGKTVVVLPRNDEVTTIEVTDIQGRVILNTRSYGCFEIKLPFQHIVRGVYAIKVESKSATYCKNFAIN